VGGEFGSGTEERLGGGFCPPPIPLPKITAKNSKLCGPTLINYTASREELEYYAIEVFSAVERGWLKAVVEALRSLF
jgi:hypothetical protein